MHIRRSREANTSKDSVGSLGSDGKPKFGAVKHIRSESRIIIDQEDVN